MEVVLSEASPVVVNDIASDSRILARDEALAAGFRALVVLPLRLEGKVEAIFTLCSTQSGVFDAQEMRLLAELSEDIGFALEHIRKTERLDRLSYYDPLTGLANRSLFLERTAQFKRSAAAAGHQVAVVLMDLERFKDINESLGQLAGDSLLRQVAEWLGRHAASSDLLARVGSDQFAIVMPVVRDAGEVARRVAQALAALLAHPFALEGSEFRVSARFGVALFPDDGATADVLLRHAGAALAKAKAGGERFLFYTAAMTEAAADKLALENQLRQALRGGEFVLHYQPKLDLRSGRLTGAEALIRWQDPRVGLVPPGKFIPILEETGLIHEVGHWALRQAVGDYLRWIGLGLPAVRIAVNVSPLQLRKPEFIQEIDDVLGLEGDAIHALELEITESLIMEDVRRSVAILEAIRRLGVTVAIDDFGTGFSSLAYLSRLPVDTLKIDRTFIVDMMLSDEGLALVTTILGLARSLRLKVVAEGVETEEQAEVLRGLGCDEMQGFLVSPALPRDAFEARFLAPHAR
jgi:diguanylate cyclase (GGDEF)-like protein